MVMVKTIWELIYDLENKIVLTVTVYLYWGGNTFDTIPNMIITRPGTYQHTFETFGEILEYLGDVER